MENIETINTNNSVDTSGASLSLKTAHETIRKLFDHLATRVLGREDVIELVLLALVADGHVLLEDYPGSGKTTLAKTLGEAITDSQATRSDDHLEGFRRIQFTPDLLPSDITGTSIFDRATGALRFQPGPIFAHVLLADEINRTSPKVQSALLEAMAEKQVTSDGVTRPLDSLFFVIATQNPMDLAGTYPLPAAQLDRFLFKIRMNHLDRASELQVLKTLGQRKALSSVHSVVTRNAVLQARQAIEEGVFVHAMVQEALIEVASRLRQDRRVSQRGSVSTRSLVLAVPVLKARAMLYGRDYVDSTDLQALLPYIFNHRVGLNSNAEALEVIQDALRPVLENLARAALR